ncbi:uncharacterized protein CIMG_06804 [Coccidioides immitis RS]|uniref:37S ribosomal protein S35, mitochondrial n=4 Tax=Coccidioides immitis TaxID=5501 RepID=J3K8Z0_COCIM|nr:uncharacterized protein CIMG_06804 [Coccidioides immitis RS]KMP03960.1 hypothetical protein CIRG_03652 [Coccidioides immitis RMSCC 2394]KMU74931.1 hypothetical protein CISG_00860 [Coccidioides immitis RMSCC 3703]KMU86113.1 hypothetical protein CIHG_03901 [Coccidioides immitis H538.4]TPX24141.1 hypothetical protein DIZ76_013484 [Coccidioides immitis]EAS31325.3 hypothetical protein CIMG_06804 [Coccidioides immitis RS]
MPPRIANPQRLSSSLATHISSSKSSLPSISPASTSSPSASSLSPFTCTSCSLRSSSRQSQRTFSSTAPPGTKLRRDMFSWLNGPGAAFKHPLPGSPNYLTAYDRQGRLLQALDAEGEEGSKDAQKPEGSSAEAGDGIVPRESREPLKPFPLNPHFVSQSVLSEELRNEIYEQVKVREKSVRAVSVLFGVDMRRVAAVVRLVELEKKMIKEKKPTALPYARAVLDMVPTTPLVKPPHKPVAHEPINDLPVHRLTEAQIFYPVSESRQFTRLDAGRVFSAAPALPRSEEGKPFNTPEAIAKITQRPDRIERVGKGPNAEQVLQPADVRIPHPHLVAFEHDHITYSGEATRRNQRFFERLEAEEAAAAEAKEIKKKKEESLTHRIQPAESRFEFRFRDVVVSREKIGTDGRGADAPGRRYGVPSYERKRGMVKIPTKVEV